ncbi:DUF1761 domain-containing protein [Kribbella sp. NPDC056861]|uniref:DUF1761 domain-containing protein n=1 Tax=Kribbella sp. NPDC056861 TaxID=3154857 RepID=UPI003441856E
MIVVGIAAAALAAFVLSSVYYAVVTPLEQKAVGPAALDRGRPAAWKVVVEVLRTALVAAMFAWVADRGGELSLGHTLPLALVLWVGFPFVLLTGSVIWEKVHPATAALHAGDWLLKLVLIAVAVGLLH